MVRVRADQRATTSAVATRQAFGQPLRPRLHLDKADVVFSLDADLLGAHPRTRATPTTGCSGASSADANKTMSRVYVAESAFSITGAVADHRLPIKPSRAVAIVANLADRLGVGGARRRRDLTAG